MNTYTNNELAEALKVISSATARCEKMQPKFAEGTSSHSLLKNRIKALYISRALILDEDTSGQYTRADLEKALPPVCSIISKCEKGQTKYSEGMPVYTRFQKMISAMRIAEAFITEALINRI